MSPAALLCRARSLASLCGGRVLEPAGHQGTCLPGPVPARASPGSRACACAAARSGRPRSASPPAAPVRPAPRTPSQLPVRAARSGSRRSQVPLNRQHGCGSLSTKPAALLPAGSGRAQQNGARQCRCQSACVSALARHAPAPLRWACARARRAAHAQTACPCRPPCEVLDLCTRRAWPWDRRAAGPCGPWRTPGRPAGRQGSACRCLRSCTLARGCGPSAHPWARACACPARLAACCRPWPHLLPCPCRLRDPCCHPLGHGCRPACPGCHAGGHRACRQAVSCQTCPARAAGGCLAYQGPCCWGVQAPGHHRAQGGP